MGKRDGYEPGTFCWVDLETTDPEGAKRFYGALFGWEAEPVPGGEEWGYEMMRLDGDKVCAVYEAQGRKAGRSHWLSSVSVESADATAARARELGGKVHGEPFDVLDLGRSAIVEDPTGAVLAAWEPGSWPGARRVNDPGCLTWNDLQTRDVLGAADFYGCLFGWETQVIGDTQAPDYVLLLNAGRSNGGIVPIAATHGDSPPHWLPYFTVPGTDEAVETAKGLGGEVLAGPADMGAGRIAVLADPQGAHFAIFEGETDD